MATRLGTDLGELNAHISDLSNLREDFRQFVTQFLETAAVKIGQRAVSGFRDVGPGAGRRSPNDTGPLRSKSGRLSRSLSSRSRVGTSDLTEQIRDIVVLSPTRARMRFGSGVPYAGIHERGGFIRVTPKMRRYFWARWYETKDPFWKRMAIMRKSVITMPARPYLRPATRQALPIIVDEADTDLVNFISVRLR